VRVTSRGRVTIPKPIRDKLGIHPGTEIDFEIDGQAVRIVRAAESACGHAVVERLRGSGHGRMSTDEIVARTRD